MRAIETFWAGMAAVGKVKEGDLADTIRPAYLLSEPTIQPAEADDGQPSAPPPPARVPR